MSFYNTIEQPGIAEFRDRGSRFLAFAYPFRQPADLKKYLQALKKEHPKAVHFCFAYRTGTDGNQYRSSDNGEPSGTAGKQILGQIDSREITDILVIVVRHFGGTLLGVPGLINAYRSSTSMVLQVIPVIKRPILIYYNIRFNYTEKDELMQLLKKLGCRMISQQNQLFAEIISGIPSENCTEFLHTVKNIRNVEISALL